MNSSSYGETSGSDSRQSRQMMEALMVFSLGDEIDNLRTEAPWTDGDRNSRMLAKDVDFRVLLTVLRDGAKLDEQDGDARASIQLLQGRATLRLGGGMLGAGAEEAELEAGDLATIDAGRPWELSANGECALVLTLAWPREKAGV
jgi:quercetin dioxygenase-like cupin family protein